MDHDPVVQTVLDSRAARAVQPLGLVLDQIVFWDDVQDRLRHRDLQKHTARGTFRRRGQVMRRTDRIGIEGEPTLVNSRVSTGNFVCERDLARVDAKRFARECGKFGAGAIARVSRVCVGGPPIAT